MTILEALTWGEGKIKSTLHEKKNAAHNAKIDAQILLSHALNKPKSYLFAHFEEKMEQEAVETYIRLIDRRARHEPVAYLTQKKEFYGRSFFVNPSVLIPRPETEILVEKAIQCVKNADTIMEIGTGSGAIAITLALETGKNMIATDIDAGALGIAKRNAISHDVYDRIRFFHGSLLSPIPEWKDAKNVLIIANLPYLPAKTIKEMDPDTYAYEPSIALFSGIDGLDHYEKLLDEIKTKRPQNAGTITLLLEIDPSQPTLLTKLAKRFFPQAIITFTDDLRHLPRIAEIKIPPTLP